jgi:nitrile hydratase accessory protein
MSHDQAVSNRSEAALSRPELRLLTLQATLIENGRVEPAAVAALIKAFGSRIDPQVDVAVAAPDGMPPAQVGAQAMLAVPKNAEGPLFREPWEALAFGLALALAERGAFTWAEWAETFGEEILRAGGEDDPGPTYYLCWLAALERVAARNGVAGSAGDPPQT